MKTEGKDSFFYTQVSRYLFFFIFLATTISSTVAQGNLLIYPKRVLLEGRSKVEKLVLSNSGNETATYSISFVEYKMTKDGVMKTITEAEEGIRFASPHVRVFPRSVTLGPGEAQTVKVQLHNTENLPNGEYRSHLYFRAERDNAPLGQDDEARDSTVSVNLKAVFGISIACIFRVGEDRTTVSMSDLGFLKSNNGDKDALAFNLNRNGNMSAYGDFTVYYTAPNNKTYKVAKTKGVGVYTPGSYREMKIELHQPDNINFSDGMFKVVFTENESQKELAVAELRL